MFRRRTDEPNRLLHVIARGVHGDRLFPDDHWRNRFAAIFDHEARERSWDVWSLTLMGTHYHVLLSTPDASLGAGLQRAHVRLASGRNRGDARRHGRVIGTRYKTIPIRDDDHLRACLRYIPMNPVKAGLCEHPVDWRWSTFAATVGVRPAPAWLRVDRVREFLNAGTPRAYTRFVLGQTADDWLPDPPTGTRDWTRFDAHLLLSKGIHPPEVARRLGISPRQAWTHAAAMPGAVGDERSKSRRNCDC